MTAIKNKNFSHEKINDFNPQPGDQIRNCNLSQKMPGTAIAAGIATLTFIDCNLTNCTPPADAILISCNTTQVSRCAHLHPSWALPEEQENCAHVVDTDEVVIDGQTVDMIYHYEDTVL